MSCIHYKFRSALEYDTITFDGLSISLADLKQSIITQKKFGKNSDFDLEVTNAQTKEEYKDEMTMIPKNSSVVVRRIPVGPKSKAQLAADRASPFSSGEQKTSGFQDYQVVKSNKLSKVTDLANADASEEDKLKAMMKQSGEDWDPSQYVKGRRPYAPGVPVPQSYVCYRCGKHGHFIRNCPTNGDARFDVPKVKRTTGIPRTFLSTAEGTSSPPASRLSPSNQEDESKSKGKEKTPQTAGNKKVPSELRCPSCSSLLTDAVLIPCCGTSYCDDCIRNYLLENEQECPSCGAENVSPDSLVINKQLRQAVNTFKNARPASPFVTKLPTKTNETTTVTSNTDGKQTTPASKVEPESSQEKAVPDPKSTEVQAAKLPSDADNRIKESSPKPVKQVLSQPQQIRIHHRDGPAQQGVGMNQARLPFDPRRRLGDFPPRGPPRVPEIHHRLSEPIRPHGLPPEHVPRVPAIRPGLGGPRHPGPPPYLPPAIRGMHAAAPALPRMPPVPTLVAAPLPRHPAFRPPAMFDPLHPGDRPGTLPPGHHTPPMSEREFYKMQKKLKSRGKKKREHSSANRPRKDPRKEGSSFDFDDELLEYRELQKSRQRLRSRSLTPTRSWSRSPSLRSRSRSRSFSRSRSRSRSLSRSSGSPARSPTPEGWDESRSPSPTPSHGQSGGANSEDEKKKRHKKRKKEQKSKGRKKQKTSHKDEHPVEQKAGIDGVKEEEKKKLRNQNGKGDKVEVKEKTKNVEKDKDKPKEVKTNKEKEKIKKKDKDKKVVSDKEGKGIEKDSKKQSEKKIEKKSKEGKETEKKSKEGKETEKKSKEGKETEKKSKEGKETGKKSKEGKETEKKSKEGKEKRKKKDKDKKEESSGKKRKSKKKHKKHKRHKKGKNKGEKTGSEEKEAGNNIDTEENENKDESSEAGNPEGKTTTDDEKDYQGTDGAGNQDESDEDRSDSDEGEQEEMEEDGKTGKPVHEGDDVDEKSSESHEDKTENGSDADEQDHRKSKTGKHQREEELLESDQEEEKKLRGNEEKLEGKESDAGQDLMEQKLLESDDESDRAEYTEDGNHEGQQNVERVQEEEMEEHDSDRGNEAKTGNGQERFYPELSAEQSKEEDSRFIAEKRENGSHRVEL